MLYPPNNLIKCFFLTIVRRAFHSNTPRLWNSLPFRYVGSIVSALLSVTEGSRDCTVCSSDTMNSFISRALLSFRKRATAKPCLSSNARVTHANLDVAKNPTAVKVGSGEAGSSNAPLQPSTHYTLLYVALSNVSEAAASDVCRSSSLSFKTAPAAPVVAGGVAGWIIAVIVVLILLLLLLILILVCLLLRHRRSRRGKEWDQSLKLKLHSNGLAQGHHHVPATYQHWSETERVNDPRYMVLDPSYGQHDLKVEALRNRHDVGDFESFEKEYRR